MPAVSVIIPALNAERTLSETLVALARQDFDRDYEVIVVDNGSEDGTAEVARRAPLEARVLRKERDRAGTARNLGAAEARAEILAFTDADCRPDPAWLRAGVEAMEAADLVQGGVRADARVERLPFDRTVWVPEDHGLYETASMFVSKRLFERIGGFEDWIEADIGVPFGEDTWFGWRARRAGARTAFRAEAGVEHAVFRRGWRDYVAERRRCHHFPALAARIPELRGEFLYRRGFLSRRTAAFDLALGAVVAAALSRSPLPLIAALPYASSVARAARRGGRRAPGVAAADLAADAVAFASLAAGSARARSVVI